MIKADFFPTDTRYNRETEQGTQEFSSYLPNIGYTAETPPAAYWLGWISPEKLPLMYHKTIGIVRDDLLTFEDVTPQENFNCGYMFKPYSANYDNVTDYLAVMKSWDDHGNNWSGETYQGVYSTDTRYNFAYGNKVDLMAYAVQSVDISLYVAYFSPNGEYIARSASNDAYLSSETHTFSTITDFISFINGTSNITITSTTYGDVTISANDLKTTDIYLPTTSGNYCRMYLRHYRFMSYRGNNQGYAQKTITPTFAAYVGNSIMCGYNNRPSTNFRNAGEFLTMSKTGGLRGSVTTGQLAALTSPYSAGGLPYIFNDRVLIYRRDNNAVYWVNTVYTIDDVVNHLKLFPRSVTSGDGLPAYGYTTDVVFATTVSENNEFLAEWQTGDLTDDEFRAKLKPWQYDIDEWAENDYTENDLPPYNPEPGDDADSIGADITGFDFNLTPLSAANNFTTLYALTTGQLAAFGRTLWAKLWSADFWKSVGTTFLNDFSINPADMMRYFINLHYFPFDLSVYPWSSTDGVYVGRAVEPIAVDTRVFSRNLIQIDGGVCYVPTYYNDFRDYEPCTNVEITIPFCGNVQIAPSECVGKFLSLKYTVDMQTGAITALLSVQSDTTYIIAQLSGQCAATIPITADNNLEFVGRIAKVTGATLFEGIKSGAEMFKESESVKGSIGIGAAVGIASGAAAVTGLPPVSVHKMGESGGFANYGGAYRAYITVTRQKYSVPSNYGHAVGYAADFTATVGSLSGLFACQNVDTSGLTCNYDERAEIKRLLESGCYM